MAKERMYSADEIGFARGLYANHGTLERVSKRTGIPVTTLSRFSRQGKWIDDRTPKVSLDDLFEALLQLAMRAALKLMFPEPDLDEMLQIEKMRRLIFAMKAICEVAPLQAAAVRGLMKYTIEKHAQNPAGVQALDIMQEYYNQLSAQNDTQEAGGEA